MAWSQKGYILDKLGNYQGAIDNYNQAVELDSKNIKSWYNMGAIYEMLEKYQNAIKCYDKALNIDPNYQFAKKAKEKILSKN